MRPINLSFVLLSLLRPLLSRADQTATAAKSPTPSANPDPHGFNDSDAGKVPGPDDGASGSDAGSFNLSKGGLIAIIVVVVITAVLGTLSTTLYFIAKKRQWQVRASLRRASRRVTQAFSTARSRRVSRQSGLVRMASPARVGKQGGGKAAGDSVVELVGAGGRGVDADRDKDVEKGAATAGQGGGRTGDDADGRVGIARGKSWFGFGR